MLTYLIKRVLIMIPTLFGISVVVFAVVTLAPGEPGNSAIVQDIGEATSGVGSPEGYRIFKRQYFLDKPEILNFRPWTVDYAEIRTSVETLLRPRWNLETEKAWREGSLLQEPVRKGELIAAAVAIEDWGHDAVPHLIAMAGDGSLPLAVRAMCLRLLPVAAAPRVGCQAIGKTMVASFAAR